MASPALEDLPDNDLIPLCLAGREDAWSELVRRHRRRVFNIAYQFVGRFDDAQDLTQDLFLKIHGSLGRYDQTRNFVFWLTRIAKNLCIDAYRQRRREREMTTDGDDVLELIESAREDPYSRVRRQEKAEFLRRGLAQLTPDLRQAVVLRDIQELSYQEIADKLSVPEGTVKSRINRGRTELARILTEWERKEKVVREQTPGRGRPLGRIHRHRP